MAKLSTFIVRFREPFRLEESLHPNPRQEPKASTQSEIERIKAMRAEARRLARQLKKKEPASNEAEKIKELQVKARKQAKAMAQPDEFVRHRVPDDLDIHCPICGESRKMQAFAIELMKLMSKSPCM